MHRDIRLMIATAVITAPLVTLWGLLGDHSTSCHYMGSEGGACPHHGSDDALSHAIPLSARDIFQLGFETGYNHGYDTAKNEVSPFEIHDNGTATSPSYAIDMVGDTPMDVRVYSVQK